MTIKYLDSKRISALTSDVVNTPTWNDSLPTATGWTFASGSTAGAQNAYAKIESESIRCIDDSNGTGYAVMYDLGSVLSNKWVIRFKLTTNITTARTSNQAGVAIGIFSLPVTTTGNTSQDSIAFLDYNDTSSKLYASYTNGQAPSATPNTQIFSTTQSHANGSYWWCEMSRDEGTTTFKIFSDSTYSTLLETETRTTSTTDVSGLRYFGAKGFSFTDATSKVDCSVSGIEVYDTVTSLTNKPTNVQDNSILVEKDTGRRYWFDAESVNTWLDTDGQDGTGSGQYDGSNTNTGSSISWQKYDEINDEIDFYSIRNDNTKTAITKDITVSTNGMNQALSTSSWVLRYQVRFDTFQSSGDTNIKIRLTSFDRSTASNDDNYASGDGMSNEFYNSSTPMTRTGWGSNEAVDTNAMGSDTTISASAQTFYVEWIRNGTALTCNISTSAYGGTDITQNSATVDADWGVTRPLKFFGLWEGSGTGKTAILQGAVHDMQITSTIPATWTIESPPTAGLKLWLDASDSTTITKDGSNLVSAWNDKSGQLNHVTQATATNQPLWVDSVQNSKPIIRFDGTNDLLYRATYTGGTLSQDFTIFAVFKVPSSYIEYVYDGAGSSNRCYLNYHNPNAMASTIPGAPAGLDATVVAGNWTYFTSVVNGSSSILRQDGSQTDTGDMGTGAMAGITIGARYGGIDSFANTDIAEILIYNSAISGANLTDVESYLATKWGI